MSVTVRLPELSPNMEKATIIRWLKRVGDRIAVGDILAEIETDKATMEMEALDGGVLAKILVDGGTRDVEVHAPIAVLTAGDGEAGDIQATPSQAPVDSRADRTPSLDGRARVAASPFARKLAREFDVDIERVAGSGPRGRIIAADVRGMIRGSGPAAAPSAPIPSSSVRVETPGEQHRDSTVLDHVELPIDNVRRAIARNLSASTQAVPHFRVVMDVECDAVLELRNTINKRAPNCRVTLNDFIIKAVAGAMEQIPEINTVWAENKLLRFKTVDIAVAIAAGDRLYAPIVRDAARKTISSISAEVRRLAERAQSGAFSSRDLLGGTTAVSNLGMFGIRSFDAIINPPQSSIFAIGKAQPQAVVRAGGLAVATMATITMSCDHRVIDGAVAAKAMERLKAHLEEPMLLLI